MSTALQMNNSNTKTSLIIPVAKENTDDFTLETEPYVFAPVNQHNQWKAMGHKDNYMSTNEKTKPIALIGVVGVRLCLSKCMLVSQSVENSITRKIYNSVATKL